MTIYRYVIIILNPLPHPKRVCEGLGGLTLPDVPAFCLAKRPRWCVSISSHFYSPPSAPSSPGHRMVAIAIMSARPGGWTPSPRPCFAFVVRLRSIGNAGEEGSCLVGPVLTGCAGEERISRLVGP